MFTAVKSPFLVPFDGTFRLDKYSTRPPKKAPGNDQCQRRLAELVEDLDDLQRKLYADNRRSLLLVFQAMDAAGKDSTMRAVLRGIDPTGCQVFSFKAPSAEELDHDFLWRTARSLPERGRIGIFNRSYYEEVIVVRVHPEYLEGQRLPDRPRLGKLWKQRYDSIRAHEEHLACNGTVILKFWLNVSKDEQRRRFLARIDEPRKNWKFAVADVKERAHWAGYMEAYEDALKATSRSWAPWYAIPADDKPYMQMTVASIIVDSLKSLGLDFPAVGDVEQARFLEMRKLLEEEA